MTAYDTLAQQLSCQLQCPTSAIRRMQGEPWDLRAYGGVMPERGLDACWIACSAVEGRQVFLRLTDAVLRQAVEAWNEQRWPDIVPDGVSAEDSAWRRMQSHLASGCCPVMDLNRPAYRRWARELLWATRFQNLVPLLEAMRLACAFDRAPEPLARATLAVLYRQWMEGL